ncbi:hypothetical protein JCM3770_007098 [Rhodotorula araucariae]
MDSQPTAVPPAVPLPLDVPVAASPVPGSSNGRLEQQEAAMQTAPDDSRGKKRKKAARACDSCRDRKLKCIWVEQRKERVCYECEKRSIPCETVRPAKMDPRKRAKLEATQGGAAAGWTISAPAAPLPVFSPAGPSTASPDSTASTRFTGTSDGLDMLARCVDRVSKRMQERSASPDERAPDEPTAVRMLGETSLTQFLSQLQPSEDLSLIDKEYGLWRSSDGSVRTVVRRAHHTPHPHGTLTSETVLELVQYYIDHIRPLFPVITVAELRALDTLSPVTLLAVCTIAASSRRFSYDLFDTVREFLRTAMEMHDPRTSSSIANIQALLIMTLSCEAHGPISTQNGSRSFLIAGNGIRMAQDLGLHRRPPTDLPLEQQQERMRVWMCCVITDTCYCASPGQPSMIDLDDCFDCSTAFTLDPYLIEMYKLCMLLQRAMKAVNRVRLSKTTDAQLMSILVDFDAWRAQMPEALQFAGSDSTAQAGMLQLMLVCFESIFLSPFVKQDALLPAHLHFRPSRARWFAVVNRAQLAIDWMLQHGEVPLDTWFIGFYALMRAASVHFFAHTKNGDVRNLGAIEAVKNGLGQWAAWARDGPLGVRAKVHKIAVLLWSAAARRHAPPGGAAGAEGGASASAVSVWGGSAGGPAGTACTAPQSESAPAPAPPQPIGVPPSSAFPPTSAPADPFPSFSVPTCPPALLPTSSTTSAVPTSTEGALPDYLQTEWQGWCDSLVTDNLGWDFLEDAALPGLL